MVELGAELPFARPEALVDFHLRGVRHPPARNRDVHFALRTASKARASPSCRARDVAYALCARRLAVEKPFAALSDHDARIGRAYRAAERTVDRRPKELRGKCAARGVPLRDAARERVRLCNPEEALGIKRDVSNIVHAVRVPLAGEPTSALSSDAADLASVLHYFHLVVWCTGRDILGAVRRDGARLQVAGRRRTALHVAELRHGNRDNLIVEDELQASVRVAHALRETELERIERKLAALRTGEVFVRALRCIKAIDGVALSGVVDVEMPFAVDGQCASGAEATALVVPNHVAVEICGDYRLSCLGAVPAHVDFGPVARNSARIAVIAAPATAREVVGIWSCGVCPALQFNVERLVRQAFPRVCSCRHGRAYMRVIAGVESVPEDFVFARRERLVVERPRNDVACGILYYDRDVRRLVELELDRLESGLRLDGLEGTPVDCGKSVLHCHGQRPPVRQAQRLRRTTLVDELRKPPYVAAHERHRPIRLNPFTEKLLRSEALVSVRAVVGLEREEHPVSRLRTIRAGADERPRHGNFLGITAGNLRERLLHAFRHHILALWLRGEGEGRARGSRRVAVAPELEMRELHWKF